MEIAMRLVYRFWRNETGSTLIEYALIGGFISAALILTFSAIGSKVNHMMSPIENGLG
jgi:Flp pilus assembly pilin Flp